MATESQPETPGAETAAPVERPRQSIDTPGFAAIFALLFGFAAFVLVEGTGEQGTLVVAAFFTLWTIASLLLGLRSSGRGDDGSASAWLAFGLPAVFFLIVLTIPLIHPLHLLGRDVCDPSTLFCDAGPAPAENWAPLIFFVIATWMTLRTLRRARRNAPSL